MPQRGIQFVAHRQGSSAVEQGTHKPLVGSSILPSGTLPWELPSLFSLFQIRLQILFPSPNRSHKANAVSLLDCAGPTLQFDKTPIREIVHLAVLRIFLTRKKE